MIRAPGKAGNKRAVQAYAAIGFVPFEITFVRKIQSNALSPRHYQSPKGKRQLTCKPGSVWPSPEGENVVAIHLGDGLRRRSCNQPG